MGVRLFSGFGLLIAVLVSDEMAISTAYAIRLKKVKAV